jgi:hypothetical protein
LVGTQLSDLEALLRLTFASHGNPPDVSWNEVSEQIAPVVSRRDGERGLAKVVTRHGQVALIPSPGIERQEAAGPFLFHICS